MAMKPSLGVNLAGLKLKNPVIVASGTYASGMEYEKFVNLDELGAIEVKSLTLEETKGNPPPRICETPSGMLNSIGLQNQGIEHFLKHDLPYLEKRRLAIIASIAGKTESEYVDLARRLNKVGRVDAIEMNVSCPNVKQGGMAFGVSANQVRLLVSMVRKVYDKSLIVKLSPNVTDIVKIARAAVKGGADIISLINTVNGMAIDTQTWRPALAAKTGGLSGPAIRPIAVRMVWQVANAVAVPVIGMGGIETGDDAIQFLLAGASAVAVGSANFWNPHAPIDIIKSLDDYLESREIKDIYSIIGKVRDNE